jgi:hypothetical protein
MSTIQQPSQKVQAFEVPIVTMDSEVGEELVRAVDKIGTWLKYLGTGDAATRMGAIEFLAVEVSGGIKSGASVIAEAITQAAEILAEAQVEAARTHRELSSTTRTGGAQLPDVDALLTLKEDELHARKQFTKC